LLDALARVRLDVAKQRGPKPREIFL